MIVIAYPFHYFYFLFVILICCLYAVLFILVSCLLLLCNERKKISNMLIKDNDLYLIIIF